MRKMTNESLGAVHTHTHTHTGSLKENKKKNIKGITLVALVVTIIILLILAGISISVLTQTGLFGKAKQAEQKSKDAQELENETLVSYEDSVNEIILGSHRDDNAETEKITNNQFIQPDIRIYNNQPTVEILQGGYKKINNWVIVNVSVKILRSDTNSECITILENLPKPQYVVLLNAIKNVEYSNETDTTYRARVSYTGLMTLNYPTCGEIYTISGFYYI